jgi:hypothetical protein
MGKEWVLEKIEVECYAGYKGEESPRSFFYLGRRHEIQEILDRWYEESRTAPAVRYEYFKIKTKEDEVFLFRYIPSRLSWELCRVRPARPSANH